MVITSGQSSVDAINRHILEFVFVFLILITSWIIYTSDMSVLPIETRLVTFLNIVLLVLVAIIPYLFDQITSTSDPGVQDYASILFTIDFAVTLAIMAVFAHVIAQEERQLVDGDVMVRFRRSRNILLILSTLVMFSLVVPWNLQFEGVQVRLLVWAIPIAMFWYNRMRTPILSADKP